MKNRIFAVGTFLAGLIAAFALAFGNAQVRGQSGPAMQSRVAGVYDSVAYRDWGASIVAGNSATGSQTITICPAYVALRDGRVFQPFTAANAVFAPIIVDPQGGSSETVTPTASSLVNDPTGQYAVQCANVTATFSNTHSPSKNQFQVVSGDQGIQEAINDASLNGGGPVHWVIDPGTVSLNTGGANTTLGSVNIPTRSIVLSATAKVTTTIATCAGGWSLGFSTGTEFSAANTTLTAGTTTDSSTLSTPVAFNAAATAPIAHCTTSNASAGALHAHFEGYKLAAPAN